MKKIVCSIVLLILSTHVFSFQQEDERRKLVEQQSQKFAKTLELESLAAVISLFETEATLLPEYHKSLHGTSEIEMYYTQFFEKTISSKFVKAAFEIIPLGEYYLELGTFEHDYQTPMGKDFKYNGKYVTYWKFDDDGAPNISAHIWGASNYFEAYDAVFSGDSKKQVTSYADDATYMTYYDPPFIGKEKIAAYFDSHYNPEVPMDSLMTKSVKVIDMGEHALKFGEYYVAWTWEGQPSYIEGKGLALYKRMKDGSIKIYRQMINHSMPASPKKEL